MVMFRIDRERGRGRHQFLGVVQHVAPALVGGTMPKPRKPWRPVEKKTPAAHSRAAGDDDRARRRRSAAHGSRHHIGASAPLARAARNIGWRSFDTESCRRRTRRAIAVQSTSAMMTTMRQNLQPSRCANSPLEKPSWSASSCGERPINSADKGDAAITPSVRRIRKPNRSKPPKYFRGKGPEPRRRWPLPITARQGGRRVRSAHRTMRRMQFIAPAPVACRANASRKADL